MISDLFTVTVLIGILASGIRLATPYLYACHRRDIRSAQRCAQFGG